MLYVGLDSVPTNLDLHGFVVEIESVVEDQGNFISLSFLLLNVEFFGSRTG